MDPKGKRGIYLSKIAFYLICFLIFINIILVFYNIYTRNKKAFNKDIQSIELPKDSTSFQNVHSDFFDRPCPEIVAHSINGVNITLRSFAGKVIIVRFSRFYRQELPYIVFLQDLAEKYKKFDTYLLFINSRGKHNQDEINKIVNLAFPVIEDDGSIRTLFNAYPEDTIIIGRDFKIKYKDDRFVKQIVYDELRQWVFENSTPQDLPLQEEISQAIKDMAFYDILKKEKINVYPLNKPLVLTVAASICTTCEENIRVQFLRELAQKIDSKKASVLLIFGKGNNPEAIEEYATFQAWKKLPISIGVIRDFAGFDKDKYYHVFQLDLDPKTYIINSEGDLVFMETRRNSNSINLDLCMRLLK